LILLPMIITGFSFSASFFDTKLFPSNIFKILSRFKFINFVKKT
jgi:hypothetical protein